MRDTSPRLTRPSDGWPLLDPSAEPRWVCEHVFERPVRAVDILDLEGPVARLRAFPDRDATGLEPTHVVVHQAVRARPGLRSDRAEQPVAAERRAGVYARDAL